MFKIVSLSILLSFSISYAQMKDAKSKAAGADRALKAYTENVYVARGGDFKYDRRVTVSDFIILRVPYGFDLRYYVPEP